MVKNAHFQLQPSLLKALGSEGKKKFLIIQFRVFTLFCVLQDGFALYRDFKYYTRHHGELDSLGHYAASFKK